MGVPSVEFLYALFLALGLLYLLGNKDKNRIVELTCTQYTFSTIFRKRLNWVTTSLYCAEYLVKLGVSIMVTKSIKFCPLLDNITTLSRVFTIEISMYKLSDSLTKLLRWYAALYVRHIISRKIVPNMNNVRRLYENDGFFSGQIAESLRIFFGYATKSCIDIFMIFWIVQIGTSRCC